MLGTIVFLLTIAVILAPLALSILGTVKAFRAHALIGIATLCIPGLGLALGIAYVFGVKGAADQLATFCKLKG